MRERAERDRKRIKLDSGGGRKILNGFINFTVESALTHTQTLNAILKIKTGRSVKRVKKTNTHFILKCIY